MTKPQLHDTIAFLSALEQSFIYNLPQVDCLEYILPELKLPSSKRGVKNTIKELEHNVPLSEAIKNFPGATTVKLVNALTQFEQLDEKLNYFHLTGHFESQLTFEKECLEKELEEKQSKFRNICFHATILFTTLSTLSTLWIVVKKHPFLKQIPKNLSSNILKSSKKAFKTLTHAKTKNR